MDWDSYYRSSFRQDLRYLKFEPRPIKLYELRASASASVQSPVCHQQELLRDEDVTSWLDEASAMASRRITMLTRM